MVSRSGRVSSLSGLPSPVTAPCSLVERQVELAVGAQRLALQAAADDVDDLGGARQRLAVGHAVEALDDLRPADAEAEDRAPLADVVEAGGGLQQRARACGSRC